MHADNRSFAAGGDSGRLAGGHGVLAALVDRVEATPARHGTPDAGPTARARHGADEEARVGVGGRSARVAVAAGRRRRRRLWVAVGGRAERLPAEAASAAEAATAECRRPSEVSQCRRAFFRPRKCWGKFPTGPATCLTSPLVTANVPPVFWHFQLRSVMDK